MTDANELRQQATEQKQAFQERFGYPATEVPGIWVGQYVAVNMLGGRGGDRQLAPTRASGMLEAISLDGVVLSVENRIVFIPRESVLQMELYETRGRGSRLRLERDTQSLTIPQTQVPSALSSSLCPENAEKASEA